jgi:cytochrome c2
MEANNIGYFTKAIQKWTMLLAMLLVATIAFLIWGWVDEQEQLRLDAEGKNRPVCGVTNDFLYQDGYNAISEDIYPFLGKNPNAGEALFLSNCAACHKSDMKGDLTGPALGGVLERWNYDTASLRLFIRNSQLLIDNGHPYANALYESWDKLPMTKFPDLSDEDIGNLLLFIYQPYY